MGDRLVTIDMCRKVVRAAVGGGYGSPLGHHLTQRGLSRSLPLYQVASWSIQPFGHNCRNAMLLRVGIPLRTIFIPILVVKTFIVLLLLLRGWWRTLKSFTEWRIVSAGGHESAKVSSVVKFSLYQSFESCKTGWRTYGMLAFHPYHWNQLKVIHLDSRVRTRKDFPGHRRHTQNDFHRCIVAVMAMQL